jgi:hypothetical protein
VSAISRTSTAANEAVRAGLYRFKTEKRKVDSSILSLTTNQPLTSGDSPGGVLVRRLFEAHSAY